MKRYVGALLCVCIMLFVGACNSGPAASPMAVEVSLSGAFKFEEAGSGAVTLKATVTGDPGNLGVTWILSQANTDCSPACGTLQPVLGSPTTSAVYTPPTSVPANQQATITARSIMDGRQNFVFNFQITAPITVSIAPKFSTQTDGGTATSLSASVNNDPTNSGVTWTFTVGGTALTCSNSSPNPCSGTPSGTLTPSPAPGLTAQYQPPNTAVPSGDIQPTITATSNADTTKSDNFSFTLVPPPISVSISNKFSATISGGSAVTINAVVTNDQFYSNAGLTWMLTSTVNGVTGLCSQTCGTLTPTPSPSLSASYTPPVTAPTDANANPTITATSVSATKSDSFSFNILSPASAFKGAYVFQLRGFDKNGAAMAIAGAFASDGLGNITGAELDINDNPTVTAPSFLSGLSGTASLDNSFNGIPRVTVCIALMPGACGTAGGPTVVLKGALSSDGTRARIIEYDSSLALMAGSMLKQDPAALAPPNVAVSYAFELDSDTGTSTINGITTTGRIVEAGQFVIGAGATSITGGVADAAQAQQPTYLFGTGISPAPIVQGLATAPDASGRGTLTLSVSNNGTTYTTNYAYYVVNSQQLDLIEVDTGGTLLTVQSGTAQNQKNLTASSLDNMNSVVALTGSAQLNGSPAPAVIVGLVRISGAAVALAPVSLNFEFNVAGTQNPGQLPSTPTGFVYSALDSTGRAVLGSTFFASGAAYLYGPGQGFLIDITGNQSANINSHAYSGPIIPQTGSQFTAASDIAGNYIAVAGGTSSPMIPNLDYAASFDAAGNYSAVADFTTSTLTVGTNGQVASAPLSGLYTNPLSDPVAGLTTWSFTHEVVGDFNCDPTVTPACNPPGPTYGALYMIGPRQFVAIGQGNRGNGSELSGIFFFDPQ